MKSTRLSYLVLIGLMLSAVSYASYHVPKTEKASVKAQVEKCFHFTADVAIAAGNDHQAGFRTDFNTVGYLPYTVVLINHTEFYVPWCIGKVVNKPIVNSPYKNYQRWFSCNGSYNC